MRVVSNGGILGVSPTLDKEVLSLISVDTLFSIALRQDGRLFFRILGLSANGDVRISILLKDGRQVLAEIMSEEF